jgi:ABC transport system ATP-binding/permease protein
MTRIPDSQTVISINPRIEVKNHRDILTFDLTADLHILGRDPQRPLPIGFEIPDHWTVVSRIQALLKKQDRHYAIYDGDGTKPSSNKLFLNNSVITPQSGHVLQDGDVINIGQDPQQWVTITYLAPISTAGGSALKQRSIALKQQPIRLGRGADMDWQLNAPTISRHHATLEISPQGLYIVRDHSTNGVFVNGQRISGSAVLSPDAVLKMGPYTFVLQADRLVVFDPGDNIRLDVVNLVRTVQGKQKRPLTLLSDISVVIEPGQFVGIVGGSGAGKSTLMKTLLGIEPVSQGAVYLNGDLLRQNFSVYRALIGYVPQTDIVHPNLTVKEVLYYAAKLRLPPDTYVDEVIQDTLQQIELYDRQDTLVKSLSGGQLKRVSIGVELLADPKLFFLDEPTSGLDPGLDKKMMQLLHRLATEGRTVILVTHATSNITQCDRLIFLGLGGHLCYFGPPAEAISFFGVESKDFADIYIQLETPDAVKAEVERYRQSAFYDRYIGDRLSQTQAKPSPGQSSVKASGWRSLRAFTRPFFQQVPLLMRRYITLMRRDPVYLFLSLLTAPIGVGLITLVVQGKSPLVGEPAFERTALARTVLFVITCASIWAGFASSLQEIVKESAIYLRERLVNLGLLAYLGSKFFTLGSFAILQSLLISLVIWIGFSAPPPDIDLVPWPFLSVVTWPFGIFFTTFLTILASASLGLMTSAIVQNSTQANSALPLLLLPQIIFSGILFSNMGIVGRIISWMTVSRWSVGAYGTLDDANILLPKLDQDKNGVFAITDVDGSITPSPIQPLMMFDHSLENLVLNWGILLIHTVIYLGITTYIQKRKDIF